MQIMFRLFVVIIMSLTARLVLASEFVGGQSAERGTPSPSAYPNEPDRPVQREIVPAPPSGPYMSTGLSEKGRGFACCQTRQVKQMASAPVLNDIPWPEQRRPPQQWMPEGGNYNFAPNNVNAPQFMPASRSGPQGWYGGAPMYAPPPVWQPMRQPMWQGQPQERIR